MRAIDIWCRRALCIGLILAAAGFAPASEPPAGEKMLWILDSRLEVPFCRVRVPEGWQVEGNAAWTFSLPVMSVSLWIRLTDPESGKTYEATAPMGTFQWRDSAANPDDSKDDGTFDTGAMRFLLIPRSAQRLLEEFVEPLVGTISPNAKIAWNREDATIAAEADDQIRRWYSPNTYVESTGAAMLVENGETRTLITTSTGVSKMERPVLDVVAWKWEWLRLTATTAPADREIALEDTYKILETCVAVNPEWIAKAGSLVRRQLQDHRPGNTWPAVDFDAYYAQANQGGAMLERAIAPGETFGKEYAPPDEKAEAREGRKTKGFVNAVVEALVLGESPYGSGINKLERID